MKSFDHSKSPQKVIALFAGFNILCILVYGIQCYVCQSNEHPECMKNPPPKEYLKNCDEKYELDKKNKTLTGVYDICRKLIQASPEYIMDPNQGTGSPKDISHNNYL